MKVAGLSAEQVSTIVPPAQYAESGDALFAATKCNRFLFFGGLTDCVDVDSSKVGEAMHVAWVGGGT